MKILVISNLYPPDTIGGYEVQCSQAVADLRQRGHDVRVLTSIPRQVIETRESYVSRLLSTPDVYSKDRVSIRSPYWEFESNLLNVENVYVLIDILIGWEPDVCYLWNLVAVGGAGIVGALEYLGVPWVWHLGDSVPAMLCNFNGELRSLGRLMAAMFSGRFLACSRTVVDKVEHLVPIQARTRIVPNWVTGSTGSIERDYFEHGHLKLVYAGRVAEEKGVFLLPDMVARLLELGYSEFTLEIIGAGMVDELASLISELGVEGHITLRGWQPQSEVRRAFRESHVFVFPTHPEDPMPLATLEAASEGCVPLIPLVSGVSEWLVDGVHCLKGERSPEGFARVLSTVMDGDVDLGGLSRRAVRAVHENFAIETVMPVVEGELGLAAEGRRMEAGKSKDLYRMALIADALLRRQVVEELSREAAVSTSAEV